MSRDVMKPTPRSVQVQVVMLEAGLAVLLPRTLLADLGISDGAELIARVETDRLVLSMRDPLELQQLDAASEGMARYRNTLAELAR